MLASDDANPEFVNPKNPDNILAVTFYERQTRDNYLSELLKIPKEEREAVATEQRSEHEQKRFKISKEQLALMDASPDGVNVYRKEVFVRIEIPGRADSILDEPARDDHKRRFPRQWAQFDSNRAPVQSVVGTPVEAWGELSPDQALALKVQKFFSVEQIASCSDAQMQCLGMNASALRQKARQFVMGRANTEANAKQQAELAKKDEQIAALSGSVERMEAQMREIMEKMSQSAPPAVLVESKLKPGRPPKVEQSEAT